MLINCSITLFAVTIIVLRMPISRVAISSSMLSAASLNIILSSALVLRSAYMFNLLSNYIKNFRHSL
jgi:hypothetical protein